MVAGFKCRLSASPSDIFGSALPGIVTAGFASGYLMSMSAANLGGRLVRCSLTLSGALMRPQLWSSMSDVVGRKRMFLLMMFSSIPLYLSVPYLVSWLNESPTVAPLALFYCSSLLSYSFFGAAYAMMPAFEGDTFGTKAITATHGRMLLVSFLWGKRKGPSISRRWGSPSRWQASTLAALAGPYTLVYLRTLAEHRAIRDLAVLCDPQRFLHRFGASVDSLEQLIAAKSVTIKNLLELCPPGTLDPTPFLYNSTMYAAAGAMSVAALATVLHRPVDPKYLTVEAPPAAAKKD